MTDRRSVCYIEGMKSIVNKSKKTKPALVTDRKTDIQQTAERLFLVQGYEKTSVNLIVEEAGVAKGTFYHHFKTKEDVLSAIVNSLLDELVSSAESVANDRSLSPIKKMEKIFSNQNSNNKKAEAVKEGLHLPENRELHEKINVQLILRLAPVVTTIVEQGVAKGQFNVTNTLETVQFLLTASQFLFDEGLFEWSDEEWSTRRKVMQGIIETSLGAKKGAFEFIVSR